MKIALKAHKIRFTIESNGNAGRRSGRYIEGEKVGTSSSRKSARLAGKRNATRTRRRESEISPAK